MSLEFEEIIVPDYEKVVKIRDEKTGLRAIISIHNTSLGPAVGGTRIYPYNSEEDALTDVLRLSKGMTYKSAIAETGLGGGKSVIIAHQHEKTEQLLQSFGKAVDALKGAYICAEDVGCDENDVAVIHRETPYVVGLAQEKSSGNPSPFTAWGTYRGIQSALQKLDGNPSVSGKTIALQGLGHVGAALGETLFWNGAKLIVADVRDEHTREFALKFGAEICNPEEILFAECDVLAPCALGGILNSQTVPRLRCRAIAGAANNQLLSDTHAKLLKDRKILYAPDFIINAGGLINVLGELEPDGYQPTQSLAKVDSIFDQLLSIYEIAEKNNSSTQDAALALADYRLRYGIGRRQGKPALSHSLVTV